MSDAHGFSHCLFSMHILIWMLIAIDTDGGGDRHMRDGEQHIADAMTQRLEALAKRLAIEQKVRYS